MEISRMYRCLFSPHDTIQEVANEGLYYSTRQGRRNITHKLKQLPTDGWDILKHRFWGFALE